MRYEVIDGFVNGDGNAVNPGDTVVLSGFSAQDALRRGRVKPVDEVEEEVAAPADESHAVIEAAEDRDPKATRRR